MAKKKKATKKVKKSPSKKRGTKKKSTTKKVPSKKAKKSSSKKQGVKKISTAESRVKSVTAEIVESGPKKTETNYENAISARNDPLGAYLAEIRKHPLLTPEEERKLAIRYYDEGDADAAQRLVTANLRFVVKIAAEYSRFGSKMIDLIQEGNVGLMHAVKEFNPYKGVRLITYAVWWIRGYIREYLLKHYSIVKIGTTQSQKKLFYNLQEEIRKLEAAGQSATNELISERMGLPEKDVKLMKQRMSNKDVSLDAPLDNESQSRLLDLQTSDSDQSADELLGLKEQIEVLQSQIEDIRPSLNEKEEYILENRILADEAQTLQEIGNHFGISRERARQLEERIIKRLKEAFLKNTTIDSFLDPDSSD